MRLVTLCLCNVYSVQARGQERGGGGGEEGSLVVDELVGGEEGSLMVEVPFCSHNQHQSARTAHKYFASLERRKKARKRKNVKI